MKISKKIIKLFLITICILFCIFLKNTNIFFSDNNITKNNKNIILKFNKNKSIKNKNNQLYFYNNKLLKNNYIYITKIWVERNKKNKIKIQKNLVKSFAKNLDKNINIKLSINPENLGVKKIFSYNFGINYKKNLGERIKNCKKLHKNQVKILINPYKISIYNYNYRTIFYTNNNFSKKMLKNLGVKQVYSKKFRKNLVKKFGYKEKYLKNFGFNLKKFGCKDEKNVKIWLKSQKNAEKFRICAEKFGYKAIKFDKNLGVKSENFRKKTIKNYVNAEKIRIYDKILDKNYFNLENNCPKMLKIRKNFHFLRKNWLKNRNNSLKINDFLCVKWVYSRKNKDFGRFLNNFKSLLRKLYCKNNNLFTLVNKNIFLNSHKINNNLFLIKNIKQNKTNIKLNKTTSAFENDLYFNLLKNTNNNFNLNNNYNYYLKNENLVNQINRKYVFSFNGKVYRFYADDIIKFDDLSYQQKRLIYDNKFYFKSLDLISNLNLSKREIVEYYLPEIKIIKQRLCNLINVKSEDDFIELERNSCNITFNYGRNGLFLNQDNFYNNLFNLIKLNKNLFSFNLEVNSFKDNSDIEKLFTVKSEFFTDFKTSSVERKNNIKVALSKFDGFVLENGEILSFNKTTGVRNEENGYKKAKIISNGTFIDGFGGGVCQVSSTLYNAFLLAGLEILEVHSHSLPVSYVDPSFDAMVNVGSSDLVVKNNTNGKILITTSSKNDICRVKIYGVGNLYNITRYSELKGKISPENDIIETDFIKYNAEDMKIGEIRRLSYPKEGYFSSGYLYFYDKNGNFVKKIKIRDDKYNPTKGIVLKREE